MKTNLTLRALAFASALAFVVVSCTQTEIETTSPPTSGTSDANARVSVESEYVEGEILVQFTEGASEATKQKALGKVNGQSIEKILTKAMEKAGRKEGVSLIKVNKKVAEAIAALQGTEGVAFAEPNFVYNHSAVSADPYFTNGSLWGMYGPGTTPANQYGSNAAAAWQREKRDLNPFTSVLLMKVFSSHTPTYPVRFGLTRVNLLMALIMMETG